MREQLLQRAPARARALLRRLIYLPDDVWSSRRRRKLLVPPRGLCAVGAGDFLEIGLRHLEHFQRVGGLRRTDRVLDIGCGIGRMAVPLTGFLGRPGFYEGFDARLADIRWCQRHISSRFRGFGFSHLDVQHPEYNWRGRLDGSKLRFPFDSAGFDFAIATSVFTHLLQSEAENYWSECARVLRAGGVLFATFFLVDGELEARPSGPPGGCAHGLCFRPFDGPVLVHDPEHPQAATAYRRQFVVERAAEHGLRVEQIHEGWWAGRAEGLDFQDVVVLRRSDLPPSSSGREEVV